MTKASLLALLLALAPQAAASGPRTAASAPRPAVDVLAVPLKQLTPGWARPLGAEHAPFTVEPLARVLAARGHSPESLAAMSDEDRRAAVGEAAADAAASIRDRIDVWTADGALDRMDAERLAAARETMAEILNLPDAYAGPALSKLKAAARWTDSRLEALEKAEMLDLAAPMTPGLLATPAKVAALASSLERSRGSQAAKIVLELRAIGESQAAEETRVAAAKALVEHLPNSFGDDHAAAVVDAALAVALAHRSPATQDVVVQGLSHDLLGARSPAAVNRPVYELRALSAAAQASGSERIRAIAAQTARALARPARKRDLLDYRRSAKVAAAASALLASNATAGPIPSPGAWMEPAPAPSLARRIRRALDWAPMRTLTVLGALSWFALGSAFFEMRGEAAAAFLALGSAVALAGLLRHKMLPALAHVGAVAGVFSAAALVAAATGPLGAVGMAFTIGYAGLMSAIAVWGVVTGRPWKALALNVLLLLAF